MKFELNGYNIENLLKILHQKKVKLYNINQIDRNKISFEIDDFNAKKVKRYIANFKVEQTAGLFKRLPKLIVANLGVVIGVFFGIIFGIFVSNYTWQIKIYGNKAISTSEILEVLRANGVKIGEINNETSEEIEDILLNNYNKIAQVSVIKYGTAIIINISEKLVYNEQVYQPIKAKFSGIITEINIITGTTNVKVGDYVNVGDLLVLPFNLDAENNKISVEPMAEIYAKMFIVGKCQIKQTETVLIKTGKSVKVYNYQLFNFNLFKGKNKNSFALFEVLSYNENVSKLVPFRRRVDEYFELEQKEITHNLLEEKENLIKQSLVLAEQNLPEVYERISTNSQTTVTNNTMFATTTIIVQGLINDWIYKWNR